LSDDWSKEGGGWTKQACAVNAPEDIVPRLAAAVHLGGALKRSARREKREEESSAVGRASPPFSIFNGADSIERAVTTRKTSRATKTVQ
jgi:hypothetical protein